MTTAERWLNEQQRMKESAAASLRWNRSHDRRSWPVLVEETIQHVIWIEADDHDEAVDRARYDTWNKVSSETRECAWMNVAPPKDKWDWDRVYQDSGDGYEGLEYDAHVEATQAWFRAIDRARLEATVEDEDRDGLPAEQRKACAVCTRWREDGHEETDRHRSEVVWARRRAEIDAELTAKAVA